MEVVLPPEGVYCVVALKGEFLHSQTFHKTRQEVDTAVDLLEEEGLNSYIAVGNFFSAENRTAPNVQSVRSFFLDLDCDPTIDDGKHYPSQGDALQALDALVDELKLPQPVVVNSGRGIHVYWPLTEAVPRDEWKAVAEQFKTTCLLRGMTIDPAVPADVARVMRAVGSSNFKDPLNPLKVEVLRTAPPVEFAEFRKLMGVKEGATVQSMRVPLDEVTKNLLANKPSEFKVILKKSIAGEGCNQLLTAVQEQETTSEPLWRAALSIAQFCKDRDKAIHAISRKHPEYSFFDTEEKALRIQGPYKCDTFWKDNPKGCEGCKHRGSITSPIQLGSGLVEEATPEDNVVVDTAAPSRSYIIPGYPFPYLRGKNGGVYLRTKDKDGNVEDVLVYDHDFYLVHTVDDPILGMAALFRVHLPQDGVREFMVPMQDMVGRDIFSKRLAREGIFALTKQMEILTMYAARSIKSFQGRMKAKKSRLQFGWADNYSAFIVGDRCITATEISYSPPSSVTIDLVDKFRQAGSLDAWKKVVAFYNQLGMERQMFALFGGFSSPLVPFSKKKGSVMSMYSETSGTGKTTMLRVINSVFGHPDETMLLLKDTPKSRINRIGTMQNIAATIDEITNETPEKMSDFLYDYLHARGGNRLQGSNNIERLNATTWAANCYVTSNALIEEKLYAKKSNPDGEMSRFLEFSWASGNTLSKLESDAIFAPLDSNYGWAGDVYVQFLIRNLTIAVDTLERMGRIIDMKAQLTNRERHWSAMVATHLSGGLMARQAGVLAFSDDDFTRVVNWIVAELIERKNKAKASEGEKASVLGAFLADHFNDTLIINSSASLRPNGVAEVPIREPRGKLCVRYEPDTQNIYIRRSLFRKFCNDRQLSLAEVLNYLRETKKYVGERRVRLGKGLAFSQPELVLIFRDPGNPFSDVTSDTGTGTGTGTDTAATSDAWETDPDHVGAVSDR